MRIKSIRAVRVAPPVADSTTPPLRPGWSETTTRGTPLSRYRDHDPSPAAVRAPRDAVWARVEAENGAWGLGLGCRAHSRQAGLASPGGGGGHPGGEDVWGGGGGRGVVG